MRYDEDTKDMPSGDMMLGELAREVKTSEEEALSTSLPPGSMDLPQREVDKMRQALAEAEALFGIKDMGGEGPLSGGDAKRITMLAQAAQDAVDDDVPGVELLPDTSGVSASTWASMLAVWAQSLSKNKAFKKWLSEDGAPAPMALGRGEGKAATSAPVDDELAFFAGRMK
jgi:hypothetical protein